MHLLTSLVALAAGLRHASSSTRKCTHFYWYRVHHKSLLEAIDLIISGAQNLVVPIKSNSRRKLQESPTAHNGCEFC
ncbi:hypothetical protein LOK49_LG09G00455 [Camellia lanceoleosa]|uniref:Uncharacterized protein n=1 Tax=Camellia lanceoleosa TaxID=1840588 RepID=A0ACC0GH93_9ERIC|nr:hypothetical protein LOK49_LG09G00455 [Camellia lanceoleosa]